jgi:hypothetical protein
MKGMKPAFPATTIVIHLSEMITELPSFQWFG